MTDDSIMLRCVLEVSAFVLLIGVLLLMERWRR